MLKAALSEAAQLRGLLYNHRSHNWRTNGWLLWENKPKPLTRQRHGDLPLCTLSFWLCCLTVFWLQNTWILCQVQLCASLCRLDAAFNPNEFSVYHLSWSSAQQIMQRHSSPEWGKQVQSVSHQEVLTCVHRKLHYRPVYLHKVKARESLGFKFQWLWNLYACDIKQFSSFVTALMGQFWKAQTAAKSPVTWLLFAWRSVLWLQCFTLQIRSPTLPSLKGSLFSGYIIHISQ